MILVGSIGLEILLEIIEVENSMNIKKELFTGVFYTALAKYSNIVVQLIVTAILARLLTPTEYGLIAIATVFILFFNILGDIGIGPAIIQYKELNRNDLNSIFTFTVLIGLSMSIVFFLFSWVISNYYEKALLRPVCQLLSLTVFFYCINVVPQNLLYKEKKFKYIAKATLLVQLLSSSIAIIMAFSRCGVFSLVMQQIAYSMIIFVLFFKEHRLNIILPIDKAPLKIIGSYSLYQFLFNIINYFSRNLDKILIGKYIGLTPLGHYEKSYRLMLMPLQNITFVITPVLQPIFSNFQNNKNEIAIKYIKIFTLLCYIGFPLSVLVSSCGRELIFILFGSQWEDAIIPFRILALSLGLQLLNGTSGAIYQSANATRQLFVSGCWCALFMIISFLFTIIVWKNIIAVSIGFVVAQVLNSAQTYYLLFKTLKYPIKKALVLMIYPVLISFFILTPLFFIEKYLGNLPLFLSLLLKTIVTLFFCCAFYEIEGCYKGSICKIIKIGIKKSGIAKC